MSFLNLPFITLTFLAVICSFFIGRSVTPTTEGEVQAAKSTNSLSPLSRASAPVIDFSELKTFSENSEAVWKVGTVRESEALLEQIREWAKEDPMAALLFARGQVQPENESALLVSEILRTWAETKPEPAWDWAFKESHYDLTYLLDVMGKDHPELALAKAKDFAEMDQFKEIENIGYIRALESMISNGNHPEAIRLLNEAKIDSIENQEGQKRRCLSLVVADWVSYEPEEAAEWVLSLPEDGEVDPEMAMGVLIESWSCCDPESLISFAGRLENPAQAKLARGEAAFRLAEEMPEKALSWLAEQEPSDAYNDAFYRLATQHETLRKNPEQSIALMAQITDPNFRDDSIKDVASEWYWTDPEAAEQFFSANEIFSAEDRQELASSIKKRKEWFYRERKYQGWD